MRRERNQRQYACLCVAGTMTQAMQIQRMLFSSSIEAEIVKGDGDNGRGCAYALQYPCDMEAEVRRLLRDADIHVRFVRR